MSVNTRSALGRALIECLNKKPINKITINDITGACGISRQTFYYYFKDIYDLLEWVFKNELEQTNEKLDDSLSIEEKLTVIFSYARTNRKAFLNVYNPIDRYMLESFIKKTEAALYPSLVELVKQSSYEDPSFAAYCCAKAISGVLCDWMNGGLQEEPAVLAKKLTSMLRWMRR